MNILQIGAGLIGKKRMEIAKNISKKATINYFDPRLIEDNNNFIDIDMALKYSWDLVIVSTPHYFLSDYVNKFVNVSKKILVEKPGSLTSVDLINLEKISMPNQIYVGYNYRFLGNIIRLKKDLDNNNFGDLISIDMELGHGGDPKNVSSWKMDPLLSGGGALLDPGIHLIDLIFYLFGENIEIVNFTSWGNFWKTSIEEKVFLHLILNGETEILIKVSLVSWKNIFQIKINGVDAMGIVNGRGGNYGQLNYEYIPRWFWNKVVSQRELISFRDEEKSMENEMLAILNLSSTDDKNSNEVATLLNGIKNLKFVEELYAWKNKNG